MRSRILNLTVTSKIALVIGLFPIVSNELKAAGFATNDQSATYLGNAYAGTVSAAQDASTAYYNPAGLGELRNNQIVGGATYTYQNIRLTNATATNSVGTAITGNNPTKPDANLMIPFGHFAWRVSQSFSLGISVVEPFALRTQYITSDIARLMATDTKISTMDISPSVAYKVFSFLSIGAALDCMRVKTKFSSGVAWADSAPEANGYVINSADKWVYGYHVGILLKPVKDMQIGVAYFSSFKPKFLGNTLSFQATQFTNTTRVNYTVSLPDRINAGITYDFTSYFSGMAEVGWTHWSKLNTITFVYNSSAVAGLKSFQYKNTWRASVGADLKVAKNLTLKVGGAYDQSPTKNAYRNAMLPDSDQYLVAVGAKLAFNRQLSLVAGYSHVFYRSTSIAENGTISFLNASTLAQNLSTLNAQVKNSADKIGLQLVVDLI